MWGRALIQRHRAGLQVRPRYPVTLPRLRTAATRVLAELVQLAMERGSEFLVLSHRHLAELASCSKRSAQNAAYEAIREGLIERPRRRFHHEGGDPKRGHRERSRVYRPGPVLLALVERARKRGEGPAAQRMRVARAEVRAELAARRERDKLRARALRAAPLSRLRREVQPLPPLGFALVSGEIPEGRKETPRALARLEQERPQAAAELSTGSPTDGAKVSPPSSATVNTDGKRSATVAPSARANRGELPSLRMFEAEGVPADLVEELRRRLS